MNKIRKIKPMSKLKKKEMLFLKKRNIKTQLSVTALGLKMILLKIIIRLFFF